MAINNEDKILSKAALDQADKVIIDFNFIRRFTSIVIEVIGHFISGPGKVYYRYHKREIEILVDILQIIKEADPLYKEIQKLENNLQNYIKEAQRLVQTEQNVPKSPWANENIASIFIIPLLKTNPDFVKSYNDHLDNYQQQMQKAIEYANDVKNEGENLEHNVPQDIDKIQELINKIPDSIIAAVIKQRLHDRLDLIKVKMTDISQARGSVDDVINRLEERRNKAINADRL